eukprot:c41811_g1_i1 orf=79-264(-)
MSRIKQIGHQKMMKTKYKPEGKVFRLHLEDDSVIGPLGTKLLTITKGQEKKQNSWDDHINK